jgi:SAM-dependent methyltransferase
MKVNFGSGTNKLKDYINIDKEAICEPDIVHDLEVFPWPFSTSSISNSVFNHSLEHLGATSILFLEIMKELYRVMMPNGIISIVVPHPRHDNFLGDPTHVRIITPQLLSLFDYDKNIEWKKMGASNTQLSIYTGVNFKMRSVNITLEPRYLDKLNNKELSYDELSDLIKEKNNIASQYEIELEVIK